MIKSARISAYQAISAYHESSGAYDVWGLGRCARAGITRYDMCISTVSCERISISYHAVSERIMDVVSHSYQTVSGTALYRVRIGSVSMHLYRECGFDVEL